MIGLGSLLWNRSGGGAVIAPISATLLPTLSALDESQTPADGYTAGAYASTAGSITGEVVTYLVNGQAEAASFDLQGGDVLSVSVLVTDSASNVEAFNAGPVTITIVGGAGSGFSSGFSNGFG